MAGNEKKLAQDYGDAIQSFKPNAVRSAAAYAANGTIAADSEEEVDMSGSLNIFIEPKDADVEIRLSAGSANSITVASGASRGVTVGNAQSIFLYSLVGTDVTIWVD